LYLGDTEVRLDTSVTDVTKQKVTATRYYSYAGSVVAMRTAAGVTWLAGGQNGTAETAINAADSKIVQRRTLPFGEVRGSTGSWPGEKGFVGGTIDASTGLTHLGAREYDPATGRFISADPLIDFTDPQQLNAYTYGRNNPFAFPDPTGLWWGWSNVGHAALDVVGLVPVVGEAADVINGAWYLAEKDYVNASLSFASAIPLAGYAATAAKGARYVDEAVEAADAVGDGVKAADRASDASKAADNVTPPATPKPNPAPKPAPPAKPKDPPTGGRDTSPGKPDGKKPDSGKSDSGKSAGKKSDGDDGETFFRTMSKEHYETLETTGRLSPTRETFISPSREFSESYEGVLVQFTLRKGTTEKLVNIGVRDTSTATARAFPRMPLVSRGWRKTAAFFKGEGPKHVNIGLGGGKALDIFNDGIIGVKRLR
jgi:RHS repeat-associated protein